MDWTEATGVLRSWAGRRVVVVPYLAPGLSVDILRGELVVEQAGPNAVRVRVGEGIAIALPKATFIEAGWVPGHEGDGLSVVQGGARVDVFAEAG